LTRLVVPILFTCAMSCAAAAAAQEPPPPAPQQPPQPSPAEPQTPASGTKPQEPAPAQARVLSADAGLIFFPVKPERTADFEKIIAKLQDALAASADPVRREQAAGWKVFKAVEPGPNNTALYLFLLDPAVKGSDYAFWKTLYEAFPADVQELYRLYTAASGGGQTLLNLQLVADLKKPD
jgi:hypothetical protein